LFRSTVHTRPRSPTGKFSADQAPWIHNATATLGTGHEPAPDPAPWPPDAEPVDLDAFYDDLTDLGFQYGPAFQGLESVWRRDGEVFAEVALPEDAVADAGEYGLHPALLDAALHAMIAGRLLGDA